mmetsp:Transcript_9203/g.20406  ORF Transcript_9203/g.20406 Transcript_9203/m.20406 type:complete len:282 (+) Transcript_9203:203-1048(+)
MASALEGLLGHCRGNLPRRRSRQCLQDCHKRCREHCRDRADSLTMPRATQAASPPLGPPREAICCPRLRMATRSLPRAGLSSQRCLPHRAETPGCCLASQVRPDGAAKARRPSPSGRRAPSEADGAPGWGEASAQRCGQRPCLARASPGSRLLWASRAERAHPRGASLPPGPHELQQGSPQAPCIRAWPGCARSATLSSAYCIRRSFGTIAGGLRQLDDCPEERPEAASEVPLPPSAAVGHPSRTGRLHVSGAWPRGPEPPRSPASPAAARPASPNASGPA